MKLSAEYNDGIVRTSLPCISYDMSAREYDASILAMASSMVAACAEKIGDGDDELSLTAIDAIADCAKAFILQPTEGWKKKDD